MKQILVAQCRDCPHLYISDGYRQVWKCDMLAERLLPDGEWPDEGFIREDCPLEELK